MDTTPTTMTARPGLDSLVLQLREVMGEPGDPHRTAVRVADVLRSARPTPAILTAEERSGDPAGYIGHLLHAEAAFSITAVVWRPDQGTEIHDHIAWCAFVVLQGVEYETLYLDHGDHLTEIGRNANGAGVVSAFAPPGDIHRVHNTGTTTAISLHVYGADLSAVKNSSVRRIYRLPVRAARESLATRR
jgi:predicted metal-dependent enzyme (double-stranded beta helix superfamily)